MNPLESSSAANGSVRRQVSAEEWAVRVDLAACYRLIAIHGMTDMIYNHISARVPGEPTCFLINAYGLHYGEITASSLHKVNHAGEMLLQGDSRYGVNQAGFIIHSAVHAARPDVNCVVHTHTRAGVAVSAMREGLLPLSLHAMRYVGRIGYHECEGVATELAERERIAADLGEFNTLILRNHGLLACGTSVAEAFNAMYGLEQACKIQVDALSAGAALHYPSREVQSTTAQFFEKTAKRRFGDLEWEAMRRLADRTDPSYRN